MAKIRSKGSGAKRDTQSDSLRLKPKKHFLKKTDKRITRAKIKKSAPGKVNLYSHETVTTQTRPKVTSEESDQNAKEVNCSKLQSTTSMKATQDDKQGSGKSKMASTKPSPKKKPSSVSNNDGKNINDNKSRTMKGKGIVGKDSSRQSGSVRGGRRLAKPPTDIYKSRHNIGKRAASGRVFSYKETEISVVFPDNYWSSASCKVDLALPHSSSPSSSSKASSVTSDESDFGDKEVQFNFEAQKKRSSSQEGKDIKKTRNSKKSELSAAEATPRKPTKKLQRKALCKSLKSSDSDSSSEDDEDEPAPVKKTKKGRPTTKDTKCAKKQKSKALPLQPRSPRIQRTACLNANAINSLMYDYSAAPKKPKTCVSPESSHESSSESMSSSNTEDESSSDEETQKSSPRKETKLPLKYKKKEMPEKRSGKSKTKPKVPDKKKVPKKRRKRDVFDDAIISVPAKRMASLNAQAIMAACKDFEEMKPIKLPKEQKSPKEIKGKKEKVEEPETNNIAENPKLKSQTRPEANEEKSPVKRKISPLRGMKLLQKQVLDCKNTVEQPEKQAKFNQGGGPELSHHRQTKPCSSKDPYEFIDVVDVEEQKSPDILSGVKSAMHPVSSPEIQVVDPPSVILLGTIPNPSHFQEQPLRQQVAPPTAKPVPQYPPYLNMPYRMNNAQIRHPQARFPHGEAAARFHHHSYPPPPPPHGSGAKVTMPQSVPNPVPPQASSQTSRFQRPPSHNFEPQSTTQAMSFHGPNQAMFAGHPPVQSVPPYPPAAFSSQQGNKAQYEVPTTNRSNVANMGGSPPQSQASPMMMQSQESSSPSSDRSSSASTEKSASGVVPLVQQTHKMAQMGNTATCPYPHGNPGGQNVSSPYMQSQGAMVGGVDGGGFPVAANYNQMVSNPRQYGHQSAFGSNTAYPSMVPQHQRQNTSGSTSQQTNTAPHNFYMRYGYYQPAGPMIQHPGGTAFHLMQQQPHLKNFMPPAIVHSQPFRSHTAPDIKAKNMTLNKQINETVNKSPSSKSTTTKLSQEKSKANTKALDLSMESKMSILNVASSSIQSASSVKPPVLIQPSPIKPTKDILDLDSKKVRVHKGAVGETDRGSPLKTTKGHSAKKAKTDSSGFPVQTYKFEPKQSQLASIRPSVTFAQGCSASVVSTNTTDYQKITLADTKTVASNMAIPFYSMPLSGHVSRVMNPNLQMIHPAGQKLPEKSPKKGTQVKTSLTKGTKPQAPHLEQTSLIRPAIHMQLPQMMKPVMPVLPIPSVMVQPQTYPQAGLRPMKSVEHGNKTLLSLAKSNVSGTVQTKDSQLSSTGQNFGSAQVVVVGSSEVKKVETTQSSSEVIKPALIPAEKKTIKKDSKKGDTRSPKRETNKIKDSKISKQEVPMPEKFAVPSSPKMKPDLSKVKPHSPKVKPDTSKWIPETSKVKPDASKLKPDNIKIKPDSPRQKPKYDIAKGANENPKKNNEGMMKVKSDKCKQVLQFTESSKMKDDPRLKHEFLKHKLEMKLKSDSMKNKSDSQKGRPDFVKLKLDSPRSKHDLQRFKSDTVKHKSEFNKIKVESPKLKPDTNPKAKPESPRHRPDSLKFKLDSPRQQLKSDGKSKVDTPRAKGETTLKQKREETVSGKESSSCKNERRRSVEEKKLSPGNGGRRRIQSAPPVIHCAWRWEGLPELKPVSFQEEAPMLRKCYPAVKHTDGDIVKVRDCVLVKSGPRKRDIPFVAKIAALWEHQYGEMMMSVLWYYRPEQTEMERLPRRERCEIFASRHRDVVPVACIDDKAYVLTFNEYCRYKSDQRRLAEHASAPSVIIPQLPEGSLPLPPIEAAAETIFLCRRVYDVKLKRILKNPQASYIQQSPSSSKPHTPNSSKSSSPHSESPIDATFQHLPPAKMDLMQAMSSLAHLSYTLPHPTAAWRPPSAAASFSAGAHVKAEVGSLSQMATNNPSFPCASASVSGGFSGVLSNSTSPSLPVVKTDIAIPEEQKPDIPKTDPSVVPENPAVKSPRITTSFCDKPPSCSFFKSDQSLFGSSKTESHSMRDVSAVNRKKCDQVVVKLEESCDTVEADTRSVSSTETPSKMEVDDKDLSARGHTMECSSSTAESPQVQISPIKSSDEPDASDVLKVPAAGSVEDTDSINSKISSNLPETVASGNLGVNATFDHIQEDKISSQNLNCSQEVKAQEKSEDDAFKDKQPTVCSSVSDINKDDYESETKLFKDKQPTVCSSASDINEDDYESETKLEITTTTTDDRDCIKSQKTESGISSDSEVVGIGTINPEEKEVVSESASADDEEDVYRLVIDTSDNYESPAATEKNANVQQGTLSALEIKPDDSEQSLQMHSTPMQEVNMTALTSWIEPADSTCVSTIGVSDGEQSLSCTSYSQDTANPDSECMSTSNSATKVSETPKYFNLSSGEPSSSKICERVMVSNGQEKSAEADSEIKKGTILLDKDQPLANVVTEPVDNLKSTEMKSNVLIKDTEETALNGSSDTCASRRNTTVVGASSIVSSAGIEETIVSSLTESTEEPKGDTNSTNVELTMEVSSNVNVDLPADNKRFGNDTRGSEVASSDEVRDDGGASCTAAKTEKEEVAASDMSDPLSISLSENSMEKNGQVKHQNEDKISSQSVASSIIHEQISIAVDQADSSSETSTLLLSPRTSAESDPKPTSAVSPSGFKSPTSGLSRIEQIVTQIKMAGGITGGGNTNPAESSAVSSTDNQNEPNKCSSEEK